MRGLSILFLFLYPLYLVQAQELFPHTEAASTIPKGIFSARIGANVYREQPSERTRSWYGLKTYYGLSQAVSVSLQVSAANHHFQSFPEDITQYFILHHSRSYPNPDLALEGIQAMVKYRFFTRDGYQKHWRAAATFHATRSFIAHDVAESFLMGDNTAWSPGLVVTHLNKRFALSLQNQYIVPLLYEEPERGLSFKSSNTFESAIAVGYRLSPKAYKGYGDLNINIYAEQFIRAHGPAEMMVADTLYDFEIIKNNDRVIYNSLQSNVYVESRITMQFIIDSRLRFDVGATIPVWQRSWSYFYPVLNFGFQWYGFKF
jgi:hypothetical protein